MNGDVDERTTPGLLQPKEHRWPRPVRWARTIADLLTYSRLAGGIGLALTPWGSGADSLSSIIRWSVLLWSTDVIDGRIARRSGTPASWIGKNDIFVDSTLALGVGIALARSGYMSGILIGAWFGICLILYAVRPVATAPLIFMLPLQAAVPVLAFVYERPEFWLFLVWIAAVAIVTRVRVKWVIESFINGLPDRLRQWIWSWLPSWLRLTDQERITFQGPATSAREAASIYRYPKSGGKANTAKRNQRA